MFTSLSRYWRNAARIALIPALVLTFACSVDQTREAKAPDVDVDVDPGQLPAYDVDWADVDVGTTERTVMVPEIEFKREKATVNVPYIDINAPGKNREERTITVEAEVPNRGYELSIREIRAVGNQLWVVSELKEAGVKSGGPTRVSDQVVVNVPDDLNIHKVIIGERPEGSYNQEHTFYGSRADFEAKLPSSKGRVLYQRNS